MNILRYLSAVWLPVLLALGGCAAHPAPFPHEAADGLKTCPGLLSGERGMFFIFGPPEGEVSDGAAPGPRNENENGDLAGEE